MATIAFGRGYYIRAPAVPVLGFGVDRGASRAAWADYDGVLRYNKVVEPWQSLQFINWPGTYIFMAFAAAVAIYESRRNRPILRVIDAVLAVCVAFAVGQMAGFHIGEQAEKWTFVAIAAAIFSAIVGILGHAYIPDNGPKPWDDRPQ